jgi:hypothetical protein
MISYIYEAIGNLFGVERPPEELGDPIDFEPGILLDSGISWIYVSWCVISLNFFQLHINSRFLENS